VKEKDGIILLCGTLLRPKLGANFLVMGHNEGILVLFSTSVLDILGFVVKVTMDGWHQPFNGGEVDTATND
jgi:hypothetical protein